MLTGLRKVGRTDVMPPEPSTANLFAALGQLAERLAALESHLHQLEFKIENLRTPSMVELEKLKEQLVAVRVFADHAEQRISAIADRANFAPSEFVNKPEWTAWRNGFDERLRAIEGKLPL